jgi:hypothetical protein
VLGNTLLADDDADAEVEHARRPDAGIVLGCLPGNGEWLRDTAMTKFPKMPCQRLSQHIRETWL